MNTNIDPLILPFLPLNERSRLRGCPAIYFVMQGEHILYDVYFGGNVVVEEAQEKQVSYKMFLPESLRARFKSICALKGVSMNEILIQLVQKWIEENENTSPSLPLSERSPLPPERHS